MALRDLLPKTCPHDESNDPSWCEICLDRAASDLVITIEQRLRSIITKCNQMRDELRVARQRIESGSRYTIALQRIIEGIRRGDVSHVDPDDAPHMHDLATKILAAQEGDDELGGNRS